MSDDPAVKPVIGAQLPDRGLDWAIAELAERQYGVVGRAQLISLGLGRRAIGHRLERGRLRPIHRGVYAVGHRALGAAGRRMAAVLVAGPGAVLSHRSAAALWGLRPSARRSVEVAVPRENHSRPGVHVHTAQLPADETTTVRGIPVTTVARTLLDLAAVVPRHQVERAINEAEIRRLTDAVSLADLVARHPRRAGTKTIKAILEAANIGATITRSELETRFLAFLDHAGLPRPRVNSPLRLDTGWIEPDCLWPTQRLIAELDGHATHRTPAAYEKDRQRDRRLNAVGYRVIRITWRQLHNDSASLATDLRALLF